MDIQYRRNKIKKTIVSHEECVSFLERTLKETGPIDLRKHRVQDELKLCFKDSTADYIDHTTIIGMRFANIFVCFVD